MSKVVNKSVTVASVVTDLLKLSPRERLKVIAQVAQKTAIELSGESRKPKKSLRGLLEKYGPAPSEEDIDEARREMWGNFPRDDIV